MADHAGPRAEAAPEGVPLTATPAQQGVDPVAAAVRRLVASLPGAGGTAAQLASVAERLHEIADEVEWLSPSVEQRLTDLWRGEGVPRHDPASGTSNPVAPPMRLRGLPDGSVRGEVVLGVQYQGPPRLAHGGISALLLDHALGVANHWAGQSGRTANLTLDYPRPTPLFTSLTITARQETVDGRKISTSGEISVDGEVCVSARGLFITPRPPTPAEGAGSR
jgi:acyl-coenzyme A thioesterase PaaI-like protein